MNFLVPRQEIAIGKHEHVCYERRNHFVLILQKVGFIHILPYWSVGSGGTCRLKMGICYIGVMISGA